MQFELKSLLLMIGNIIAVNRLPVNWARSITSSMSDRTVNSAGPLISNASSDCSTVKSAVSLVSNAATDSIPASTTDNGGVVLHIKRRREAYCPPAPDDLDIIHAPCDMDTPELSKYIETLPNQCICAYNARHDSVVDYRKFKVLQLEAFFFGQYSERFKRFEIDPNN